MSNIITWADVDWTRANSRVRKIQYRIYKASAIGNLQRVHWLQKYLIHHWDAKLLAVRQVTVLEKGKKVVLSGNQRISLASELSLDGRSAQIRRIPKPGKTEPLGMIRDRAKQALAKFALEPQWEASFEPNSYGFRPGRSCHDAIEAVFLNLHHGRPKWGYVADVRKCFDRIHHDALLEKLNTFPQMKRQIRAWLKSGVMEGYANTPKDNIESTSQEKGGISPLLANIVLNGLEFHLKTFVSNLPLKPRADSGRGKLVKKKALGVIRYADDFLLLHENKEILHLCVEETKKWLQLLGLQMGDEKSAIRDVRQGFPFLGFQIMMVRKMHRMKYKVKITPSKSSQKRFLLQIRNVLQRNKAISSYSLIQILRPILIGWANYYKYCECASTFAKLTDKIFRKVRAWVFRRDQARRKVKQRYFPTGRTYSFYGRKHKDNWILCGRKKFKNGILRENFLPHIQWVPSKKHIKVKETESPFSGSHYWALRESKHSPYPLRVRELLGKQKNCCPICKRQFNIFDSKTWEVDHILPRFAGGKDEYSNLQLLHKECHEKKTTLDMRKYRKQT